MDSSYDTDLYRQKKFVCKPCQRLYADKFNSIRVEAINQLLDGMGCSVCFRR